MTSPAVTKLLSAADEVLAMARELRAQGRPADCIACAMVGNAYVRAARAMQDMEDAAAKPDPRGRR
jgi:ribosomal protein L22